jgi:hypothetical protein
MFNAIETIIEKLLKLVEQSIAQLFEQLKSSIINN